MNTLSPKAPSPMSRDELDREAGELLPPRETLALFTINVAPVTAINVGIAVNAATLGSLAQVEAGQWITSVLHG